MTARANDEFGDQGGTRYALPSPPMTAVQLSLAMAAGVLYTFAASKVEEWNNSSTLTSRDDSPCS